MHGPHAHVAAIAALFQGAVTWAFRRGSVLAELLERESWHWPTRWAAATAAVVAMLGVAGVFLIRPMTSQLSEMPQWWQQKSNDRAAVRWLERHHQPDDLVLTPFLSRFAVSWYAHSPRWNREPSSLAPVELLHHGQPGIWCDPGQLQRAVSGHRRVLFFQGPEFFPGLETILSARLKQLGTPVGRVHRFGKVGFVRVFDVSRPPAAQNQGLSGHEAAALSRPDSCVTGLLAADSD